MKLHILGSCSGTEPMPGRHHTSWMLETKKGLYVFDAGENASHTAHTMGLDLTAVKAIFLSHMHLDHIYGLPGFFWIPPKLAWVKGTALDMTLDLYVPDMEIWQTMRDMIAATSYAFKAISIREHPVTDGLIFDNGDITVEALHNYHIRSSDPWQSYSYRICGEGKTVIFTGDIKESADVEAFLGNGCDVLLTETGHHSPDAMPKYLTEHGYFCKKLLYIHHGRAILNDYKGSERMIRDAWNGDFRICADGDTFDLDKTTI